MAWILIPLAVVTLWAVSLYRILSSSSSSSSVLPNSTFLSNGKKRTVLLVIAHPDDECMFFAPTILFLASKGHILHILCLSTGNAEGKGNIRKEELYQACAVLKVASQRVKVLDHIGLQDGFGNPWDHQLIATIINDEIKMHNIDLLVTFDEFGVSGHPNHCDVHHGIRILLCENSKRDFEAWGLISTSFLRKYNGPVDVLLSTYFPSYKREEICSLMNSHPGVSYLAMAEHYSQWTWFRKLFVVFSSYTYINTLRRLNFF